MWQGQGSGRRDGLPISLLLPLVLVALVLVTVVPVLAMGYFGARENTSRLLRDRSELALDAVETKVRGLLKPPATQLAFIAAALRSGRIDLEDGAALDAFLLGALAAAPQIEALKLYLPDGTVRRYGREGLRVSVKRGPRGQGDAKDAGEGLTLAAPAPDPDTGRTLLPLLQRVLAADGAAIEVIALVSVTGLSAQIAEVGRELQAVPFVLFGPDRVLAHPLVDLEDERQAWRQTRAMPGLEQVGDAVLAAIWTGGRHELTALAPFLRSSGHWTWVGPEAYAYFYRELRDYGAAPWIVGFHTPGASSRRERWTVLAIGFAGLAILAAAAASAVVIGRRLGRPVLALAQSAERVEALDFASVLHLRRGPIAEVNAASAAFERMARGLMAFETYVPRTLVRRLMAGGGTVPASEAREVTVMFTDLEGYTEFSRGRPAAEVAAYLNAMFARIGPVIEAAGGTIDKYTGDGLMAFWGAPEPATDHAARACRAALAVARAVAELNEERCWQGLPVCPLRIGLHTGEVVVGNVGFPGRLDYTVVGEAVNLAQRVQAASRARFVGAPAVVLVSEATFEAAGESPELRFVRAMAETESSGLWRLTRGSPAAAPALAAVDA